MALAVIGLGVWAWVNEGPLWWWVMTKELYGEGSLTTGGVEHELRGYSTWLIRGAHRIEAHGWSREYYVDSGLLESQSYWEYGELIRQTEWESDGTVSSQYPAAEDGRYGPPWRWGITDQTTRSMPEWMKDDAKWQEASR